MVTASVVGQYTTVRKSPKKKPFNAIPGETFEHVTSSYRFVAEQVSMDPPISAYHVETSGYTASGYQHVKPEVGFGGFKGRIQLKQEEGCLEFYMKEFDEIILVEKPWMVGKNLIVGDAYWDLDHKMSARNLKTGEKIAITLVPRNS